MYIYIYMYVYIYIYIYIYIHIYISGARALLTAWLRSFVLFFSEAIIFPGDAFLRISRSCQDTASGAACLARKSFGRPLFQ